MDKDLYNRILNTYTKLKETKKRVSKNDILINSLLCAGGTYSINDIDLFFKIKKSPQKYFFNQLFKKVDCFQSGYIMLGRKKVGEFFRFDTFENGLNINEYLINDKVFINKVGMNYAPELRTNTCYLYY